ncbi:MAG: hypothetical protein IJT63_03920, partial [Lachnospiraceae bacterium]|nr:hypothetical protein [Lachnospiraceae bacterium]
VTESDNSTTEKKAELNPDGTAKSTEVNKDASGKVNTVASSNTDSTGVTTEGNFEGKSDGSLRYPALRRPDQRLRFRQRFPELMKARPSLSRK